MVQVTRMARVMTTTAHAEMTTTAQMTGPTGQGGSGDEEPR
jgi:hypothetical protein